MQCAPQVPQGWPGVERKFLRKAKCSGRVPPVGLPQISNLSVMKRRRAKSLARRPTLQSCESTEIKYFLSGSLDGIPVVTNYFSRIYIEQVAGVVVLVLLVLDSGCGNSYR